MKISIIALFLASVIIAAVGAEENDELPRCVCTREMAPVCATNGRTYANPCEFRCAKGQLVGRAADEFKIARGGSCDGPEIPQFFDESR